MALLPNMLTTDALDTEAARLQRVARGRLGAALPNALLFLAIAGVASGARLNEVPLTIGNAALPIWLPGLLALAAIWPVQRYLRETVFARGLAESRYALTRGLLETLLHHPRQMPSVLERWTTTRTEAWQAMLLGLRPGRGDLRGRLDLLLLRFGQGQRDLGLGGRERIDGLPASWLAGLMLCLLWLLSMPMLEATGELWAVELEHALRSWPGWGVVIALCGPLAAAMAGSADMHLAAEAQALAEALEGQAQLSPRPGDSTALFDPNAPGSGIV